MVDTARAPSVDEVAARTGIPRDETAAAFRRLHDARAIVLDGDGLDIRMANPFSAIPTPFTVETPRGTYYGNCVWDSLGIPSALRTSATIRTPCPDGCAEELVLRVDRERGLQPVDAVVHFAFPARKWWEDIVHT